MRSLNAPRRGRPGRGKPASTKSQRILPHATTRSDAFATNERQASAAFAQSDLRPSGPAWPSFETSRSFRGTPFAPVGRAMQPALEADDLRDQRGIGDADILARADVHMALRLEYLLDQEDERIGEIVDVEEICASPSSVRAPDLDFGGVRDLRVVHLRQECGNDMAGLEIVSPRP